MRPLLKLNRDQLFKMSDIFSDTGLVALATVVIPSVIDKIDPFKLVLGLVVTIFCWVVSLVLRK
ncbi:hypothetical protein A3F00_05090 [Candidatus Daviesbacteria bacterium RIFCSPHIGHO2_12_FULL_37_11]|uniref:Uncharacterized protein n=1 Tax=Candidatus Daviesbacteria bacterium RIFCSPHIGHO2_12_FULL_37_11 TaxID=1797777 RepID=A0A1F5K9M3_9BACT|nr:MAG: hypothetical protein A2111_02465 [Candidatus Daviesbacteria bacterium GWA1_38_6]OGE37534.1 MAG: hypothetical protein A3F00_05090 [Candidatus Daviesbacteria bacterium RIFCSPHIGHO2_12_FULL_37_11]OGE45912.1 MAG: hypothetical protein A3B39_01765 [Candidatus Daviesbacteria bacterium RIFCSPLOWO2_01_FULL_37_10]